MFVQCPLRVEISNHIAPRSKPSMTFQLRHTLSGELDPDIDSLNFSYNKQRYEVRSTDSKRDLQYQSNSSSLEYTFDHNFEIEQNKRMRSANVNPWTLRFKNTDMELRFSQLREDMFKSNMLCCFIIWLFIVAVQVAIIPL